jgi:hypothetical protein
LSRDRGVATELRVPADAAYILVAKRTAAALAAVAGFSLEAIDELNIAVAQACQRAIGVGERMWGPGNASLKLSFQPTVAGMQIEVRTLPSQKAVPDEAVRAREAEALRRATAARAAARRLQLQAESQRRNQELALRTIQEEAGRLAAELDLEDVAVNMIGLFVDDVKLALDTRGSMRMTLVKYHGGR